MPEICRFYGIVIKMFFDDHAPPHFHAEYGTMSRSHASFGDLRIVTGSTVSANTASAQVPSASPEQRATGARVVSVVFAEPASVAAQH